MRDAADEALYKAGVKVQQIEGNQSSTWILMDYGDIIIHIFSPFYENAIVADVLKSILKSKVTLLYTFYIKFTSITKLTI